jgi:hypothetical protein
MTNKVLKKLIKRCPKFMHLEFERIQNVNDLDFQVAHEIDLGESKATSPRWTAKQLHRAKMYYADVHYAAVEFCLEHPELCDELNQTQGGA